MEKLNKKQLETIVRKLITESPDLKEDFGGAEGEVTINITGHGAVKTHAVHQIMKALKLLGGDITLQIDGVDTPYLDNMDGGGWMM